MLSRQKTVPRIALALSGGAARGIAHVGVLRALTENDIPIDAIAGTSAGALVGGAFASGMPLDEIEAIGRSLRWRDIGRMTMSRLGVQTNERLEQYLRARLPKKRFEEFPIPLAVVATDLQSGKPVIMREKGDVPFAIRASCAIPGWYVPVVDFTGRQLVDGGLVANIPAQVARAFDVDIVIAVDVNAEGAKFLSATSVIGVVLQSMMMVQKTASLHQLQTADYVIRPSVGHIRWDEMSRANELIKAGYEAGVESISEIRNVIETAIKAMPRWYQFGRKRSSQRFISKVPIQD
ncbi:MAG: esterase [Acidobacteria bacterium]|nr:MAG: esterase [Acidobacteriota bacterium]